MSVGEKVRGLRKALSLTQKEFAAKVPTRGGGIYDWSYIGKIERGDQWPSIKYLKNIGEAHGKPLSYFFEDRELEDRGKQEIRTARVQGLVCLLSRYNWELSDFRNCRRTCEHRSLCQTIRILLDQYSQA